MNYSEHNSKQMSDKTYAVTVEAIVSKTYHVKASDEQSAVEQAHELFSASSEDGVPDDRYEQETVSVKKL